MSYPSWKRCWRKIKFQVCLVSHAPFPTIDYLTSSHLSDAVRDKIWETMQNLLQDSVTAPKTFGIALKLLSSGEKTLNIDRLTHIVSQLLKLDSGLEKIIAGQLKSFAKFPDFLQHSWIILSTIPEKVTTDNLERFIMLMSALPITTWEDCPLMVADLTFKFDYQKVRKALNSCWNRIMRAKLDLTTRRHALTLLLESLLVHIEKPILLTDFLMYSLDIGGPVSLLALQGVFTLIQEHNITYPDIYTKIYQLFDQDIFHTKYKARLFYLTDLFMSSTHLPEALVGAFVKRVSRLALGAPPQDIIISLYFIANLIIRHKGLKRLLNDTAPSQMLVDPYSMTELDPCKSNALESSLWEVEALTQHVLPTVSTTAKNILKAQQKIEYDLAQVLEVTETDVSILYCCLIAEQ